MNQEEIIEGFRYSVDLLRKQGRNSLNVSKTMNLESFIFFAKTFDAFYFPKEEIVSSSLFETILETLFDSRLYQAKPSILASLFQHLNDASIRLKTSFFNILIKSQPHGSQNRSIVAITEFLKIQKRNKSKQSLFTNSLLESIFLNLFQGITSNINKNKSDMEEETSERITTIPDFLFESLFNLVELCPKQIQILFCNYTKKYDEIYYRDGVINNKARIARFVKAFNLQREFPLICEESRIETLSNLSIEKCLGHLLRSPADKFLLCSLLFEKQEHYLIHHISNFDGEIHSIYEKKLIESLIEEQRVYRIVQYYQLPQDVEILFIDTITKLKENLLPLIKVEKPIAIDVEWFPKGFPSAEILQIAQEDMVFILDVGKHSPLLIREHQEEVNTILNSILVEPLDKELLVFGTGDLKALENRCKGILPFWRSLKFKSVCSKQLVSLGLSHVVEKKFGKPMDKMFQQSNWKQRPLSSLQLRYAALDAWVLLQI